MNLQKKTPTLKIEKEEDHPEDARSVEEAEL